MTKYILLFIAVLFSLVVSAQEKEEEVPFAVIENVPVYPGCEGLDNSMRKKCMSQKISELVGKKFNVKKASKGLENGTYNVYVSFKIDKTGDITNIKARGPNAALEKEAKRVISKLPRITPGKVDGKPVGVLYALPIKFKIDNNSSKN